jgi:hypothetical protein
MNAFDSAAARLMRSSLLLSNRVAALVVAPQQRAGGGNGRGADLHRGAEQRRRAEAVWSLYSARAGLLLRTPLRRLTQAHASLPTTMRIATIVALVTIVSACHRDTARDSGPVADPLKSTGAASAPATEVLPLDQVAKSQAAAVSQRVANTDITITYSRPVARGRALFGALVPYNEVWNPGADQATAIAFSRDVQINAARLPAGKYSLWAIPRADTWTMIFSKAADVYHTPYPGEAQDALRLDARPEPGAHLEALTFYFPTVEGKAATLRLHWGETMVSLSIRVP